VQVFFGLVFLIAIGVVIFVVQNLAAPVLAMNFLFWKFETSPIDVILRSLGCGMLIILLLWIPRGIKASFRVRNLEKRIENLERELKHKGEGMPKEL
jgi:uncharacterized integral membrane protein